MSTSSDNASQAHDIETREWIESLEDVLRLSGPGRVQQLLRELEIRAHGHGVQLPFTANTPYINTIHFDEQPPYPGNREIEWRIKSILRWNAMAMVVRANKADASIGGHISTYASAATLYEVGSTTFSARRTTSIRAIWSISRATPVPASMPAPFWKAVYPPST
jgi:pyruvate dehydrogenase E1 component